MSVSFDPCGHYVYVLWGDDETKALYVGSSSNVMARVGTHVGNGQEKPFFRRVELHEYPTFSDMRRGEMQKIAELEPLWNVQGLPGRSERAAQRAAALAVTGPFCYPHFHLGPCVNCGRAMSRMDGDRPRAGRCEACYRYLQRTGMERPGYLVSPGTGSRL